MQVYLMKCPMSVFVISICGSVSQNMQLAWRWEAVVVNTVALLQRFWSHVVVGVFVVVVFFVTNTTNICFWTVSTVGVMDQAANYTILPPKKTNLKIKLVDS